MISNQEKDDLPSSLRQYSSNRNSRQRTSLPLRSDNEGDGRRNADYATIADWDEEDDDNNNNNNEADHDDDFLNRRNESREIFKDDLYGQDVEGNLDGGEDDNDDNDQDVDTVFHSLTAVSTTTTITAPSTAHFQSSWWQALLYTNVLADAEQWTLPCCCCFSFCEPCVLLVGVAAIRFVKFVLVTLVSLVVMHTVIRWMGLESKKSYTLWDMIQYDLPSILLDCSMFFIVGRLYAKPGVDHLAFVGVSWLASSYTSGLTTMRFLQHSVTLYDMHCYWPLALWIFVATLIPLILTIIVWHVRYIVKQGRFAMKLTEMALTISFFLLPNATSPHFHFHHWFAGWLLGMHCNLDTWWSRATMAWCWGQYINGIAVYGRHPLLTCGYSYYLSSQALQCSYLKCYYEEQSHHHNVTATHNVTTDDIPPIPAPDWLHCTR